MVTWPRKVKVVTQSA